MKRFRTHVLLAPAVMLFATACSTAASNNPGAGGSGPDGAVDDGVAVPDSGPASGDGGSDGGVDATPQPQPPAPPPPSVPWLPVQMNDVSILFPLPASAAERAASVLTAGAIGARGTLLPSNLYDTVGHITGSSPPPPALMFSEDSDAAYANLMVVAVRLDPCFADLAPDPHGAGCTNQLRLVLQDVTLASTGQARASDSALHVFYSLTRDELLDVAQGIAALRVASGHAERLGPLAPHPVMVTEGLTGPMAAGVRALVLGYAGAQNLSRITKLSTSDSGFVWHFSGFDITSVDPPAITPLVIPTLPSAATSQTFFRNFGTNIDGTFTPVTTGPDLLTAVAQSFDTMQPVTADVVSAVHALARIENPTLDSLNTVDCAGCHLATPLSRLVAGPDFGLSELTDPAAFAVDGASVLPSEVQATFNPASPNLEVHAFSYVGADPVINQRAANETAAVVEYLNANAPAAWPAPDPAAASSSANAR